MSHLEYIFWFVLCGIAVIVFGYILMRALTISYYRSRSEYDRRMWDKNDSKYKGEKDNV